MIRWAVALLFASSSAQAYDSIACVPDDCEGRVAARTAWALGEHAQLWLHTRALAGLPARVDEAFTVTTPTVSESLAAAPFDVATQLESRTIEIAAFAHCPTVVGLVGLGVGP